VVPLLIPRSFSSGRHWTQHRVLCNKLPNIVSSLTSKIYSNARFIKSAMAAPPPATSAVPSSDRGHGTPPNPQAPPGGPPDAPAGCAAPAGAAPHHSPPSLQPGRHPAPAHPDRRAFYCCVQIVFFGSNSSEILHHHHFLYLGEVSHAFF